MTQVISNRPRDPMASHGDKLFLTDGGLETVLIFHNDIDLPHFAAFDLLKDEGGRATLRSYYADYLDLARSSETGFVLETPTWRASRDWGQRMGYDDAALRQFNLDAVALLQSIRDEWQTEVSPVIISGNLGPRGDGYVAGDKMNSREARDYHAAQIDALSSAGADVITAITLNYVDEAIGIVLAATAANRPAVIGFTTETDGRLPDGTALSDAIEAVDEATGGGPLYYMINCAHVDHFAHALEDGAGWTMRIRGVRANASRMTHAELDEAEELDDGDPQEFGDLYADLRQRFPHMAVFGGCCGTDHRHVDAARRAIL